MKKIEHSEQKATKYLQGKGREKAERESRMKNSWEKKSLILKLAQQISKTVFVQNEVTN